MNEKYPLALPEGSVLAGQYIIADVLGQGGFGITYLAADHKTGNKVAIKEYFPDSMATRSRTAVVPFSGERGESYEYGKECFLQEAQTLAQFIGSENIVRIYSYFEENGTAYFVMDYIKGISLDDHIKQNGGKLSFEETYRILAPVMNALSIVHSRGIVHRDIAPDNIYITNDGTVKLLDFGAARYSLGDRSQSLDIVLKHGFAPKEQYVRRGKQGPFTDVYALAATYYFALTGKRPPDSVDRMDEDNLIPPSNMGVAIPAKAEQAILTALSVRAEDRFQNMQMFLNAMGQEALAGNAQPVKQIFFAPPENSAPVPVGVTDRVAPLENSAPVPGSVPLPFAPSENIMPVPRSVPDQNRNTSIVDKTTAFVNTVYEKNPRQFVLVTAGVFCTLALCHFIAMIQPARVLLNGGSDYGNILVYDIFMSLALLASCALIIYSLLKGDNRYHLLGNVLGGAVFGLFILLCLYEGFAQEESFVDKVVYALFYIVRCTFYGGIYILCGLTFSLLQITKSKGKRIPDWLMVCVCSVQSIGLFSYLRELNSAFVLGLVFAIANAAAYIMLIICQNRQSVPENR